MDMNKLFLTLALLLATVTLCAQGELATDTVRRSPQENYKEFGGFLLDMGLLSILPVQAPKAEFPFTKPPTDYNQLFSLNPNVTFTQGLSTALAPLGSFVGFGAFGGALGFSSQQLQMGSFRLKNGMRIHTYGEYNADGYRMPNRSALPWEKNNFKGAFELKSANGNFGIRIEVQQGRNAYPY